MRRSLLAVAFLGYLASAWSANAGPLNIVALGASNTSGRGQGSHPGGVSSNQAYPAQLEAMLRAKGIDAHVRNAGFWDGPAAPMTRWRGAAKDRRSEWRIRRRLRDELGPVIFGRTFGAKLGSILPRHRRDEQKAR